MSILVVGSVALDSVQTPFGQVSNVLGGSAMYFAVAASLYAPVRLVAVVGKDFPPEHLTFLRERGVDLAGLQVAEGYTFRWSGRYDYDLNTTENLDTQLNVFADFHPVLPPQYRESDYVFLANIDPELQLEVLQQVRGAKLTMMDTREFWITGQRAALERTMRGVDLVTMNEAEARLFGGTYSLPSAARQVLSLGPRAVIIKKGEYGAVMFSDTTYFVAPAYPLEEVKDPTGAGDAFAGGFLGYLARSGDRSPQNVKKAIVRGCAVASFVVGAFSVEGLRHRTEADIEARYREFLDFTQFEV